MQLYVNENKNKTYFQRTLCHWTREKKGEREKEKNHQKGNEETFSSLFHGKFIG